jgi:uncharacterized protein YxjI
MLLDHNKFVVKSQSKKFSSKKDFEIVDAESGQMLGTAKDTTPFFSSLLGAAKMEVRDVSNNTLLFSIGRSGWLVKKDQVLDSKGQVVGRFKAKMFSLSGGFHVYDNSGKHLAEIKGKMLKAEYKFLTPDKTAEMGSVSRTWSGLAKSLATGDDSYAVQIDPKYTNDPTMKTLLIGAAIALESIFKKKKGEKSGSDDAGGGADD